MIQLHILFSAFLFALGACVGSFLNVVIWRLPHRGREVIYLKQRAKLTLSWPPSHCPVCDSPIHWYQNIPILSWLALRGHCAHCRTSIPVRYPLVELGTATLYLAFYLAYFVAHWTPGFEDLRLQWPAFAFHLLLVSALLAASAIDADWFIIPLSIPYMLIIVALLAVPFIDHPVIPHLDVDRWFLAKPILGCAAGLILANLLVYLGILNQSFADPAADAPVPQPDSAKHSTPAKTPQKPAKETAHDSPDQQKPIAPLPGLSRLLPSSLAVTILLLAALAAWLLLSPRAASLITVSAALLIFLIGVLPRDAGQTDVTDEVLEEISVPHARREILHEFLFLLIPFATALLAHYLPWNLPTLPWLARLLGVLLGILAGGGIVWLIRIGGTLVFGREAMGLGDVHLMAGIGAVVGAPLVLIAFLTAPFLGILWAIILKILGKPNVLPYGPWLSVAAILSLLLGNHLLAWYQGFLFPPVLGP